MSSRRFKKSECAHENCGSRRFHVGEDGFTYCDRGHQQSERGTVIAEDTGEFVVLGRKSKKQDSDAESATSRASSFSGSHAFEHYLLCIQLVLRKQLHWLIGVQKLPDELETLVKDLWTLRLQRVQSKVLYESETDTEAPSSQVFSSQSESEHTTASRSTRRSRKRDEQVKGGSPKLVETLSLCYIGLLLLRIPVTVADIHRWTNAADLLYYRAVQQVPLGMRERLPPRYQALLEPQDLLPPSALHEEVLVMLRAFSKNAGMSPPVLNLPLVLYRWLRDLMLPVEIYAATQRLAEIVALKFEFTVSDTPGARNNLQYPETRLMALLVVASKLLFPLDGIVRDVDTATDLSAICMDWKSWQTQLSARESAQARDTALSFEQAFAFGETDCFEAADDKLDAYLDWYQESLASEEIRTRGKAGKDADLRRALFEMFPLHTEQPRHDAAALNRSEGDLDTQLQTVQGRVQSRGLSNPSSSGGNPPTGSHYRRFRSADELAGVGKVFFERAAGLAGLSVEEMVQAVLAVERKVQKVEEKLRKNAAGK